MKWLFHYVSYIRAFWKICMVTIHKWVQGYYIFYRSGIVYYVNDNLIIYTAKHLEPLPQYMDQDTAEVDLCTYL